MDVGQIDLALLLHLFLISLSFILMSLVAVMLFDMVRQGKAIPAEQKYEMKN
jgi:hypothetical protein